MGVSANVQSIDALKEFRAALCTFIEEVRNCLGEADADLTRCAFWLSEDRQRYWKSQITKREELLRRAKMALLEKKLQKTAGGGRPSCVDEEKALVVAQRRFEEAQTKSANTKRWIRRLDEQVFQYKGLLQALNHSLDVDAVNAAARLERMVEALEAYVALPPPAVERDLTPGTGGPMRRPLVNDVPEPAPEPVGSPQTPDDAPAPPAAAPAEERDDAS